MRENTLHAASSSFCTKINNFNQSNKTHKKLRTFYSNSVAKNYIICDVKEELDEITQYHLNKLSTNYDMVYITEEQDMDKTI